MIDRYPAEMTEVAAAGERIDIETFALCVAGAARQETDRGAAIRAGGRPTAPAS